MNLQGLSDSIFIKMMNFLLSAAHNRSLFPQGEIDFDERRDTMDIICNAIEDRLSELLRHSPAHTRMKQLLLHAAAIRIEVLF